jgi:hypothetical protein
MELCTEEQGLFLLTVQQLSPILQHALTRHIWHCRTSDVFAMLQCSSEQVLCSAQHPLHAHMRRYAQSKAV